MRSARCSCSASIVWLPVRKKIRELRVRDGFLVVALFWVVLGGAGAAPLLLSTQFEMSFTDAIFEAVSGFTTTGAIIFPSARDAARSRCCTTAVQIEWLGGIGIVVLAVALLPMLGVGGMQLLRAETPGPGEGFEAHAAHHRNREGAVDHLRRDHDRVRRWRTGRAGMTPFDAIVHSFTTVSTGGNSTHDASIGYFDNVVIEDDRRRLHVHRRRELLAAFPRLAPPARQQLFSRSRVPACSCASWRVSIVLYTLVLWLTRYARRSGARAAAGALPRGVDADHLRFRHRQFFAVARRAAGDSDAVGVHRRLRRFDLRRHESRALAAACGNRVSAKSRSSCIRARSCP